jgi:glycosyltransferase involved in cell wall biosynthesis
MSSNLEHHPVLTAVIPVSEPASELETLVGWVSKIDYRISVVLVVNKKFNDSLELLRSLTEGRKTVRVVEIESAGPGSARESGRKYCETEFIAFWDCDDLPYCDEILKNIAGMDDSIDVLIGDYSKFDMVSLQTTNLKNKRNYYSVLHTPGIWRMVFRMQSISSLHFPDLRMAEDHVFLGEIISSPLKIDFAEAIFYRYSVGRKFQLSLDPSALSEIPLALNQVKELLNNELLGRGKRKFLYFIYVNLSLSHARRINSLFFLLTSIKKQSSRGVRESLLLWKAVANVMYMKITYKRQFR